MARRSVGSRRVFCAVLVAAVAAAVGSVRGDAIATGDVSPATDPLTWTMATTAYIGDTGAGSLMVNLGSALTCGTGSLGNGVTGAGTAVVNGTGSRWISPYLYVGNAGTGDLAVTNGAYLYNQHYGYLGYNAGSFGKAKVDGAGSQWSSNSLWVGNNGTGVVNVTNQGYLGSRYAYLGVAAASAGTVTVNGTGSQCYFNTFYAGYSGTGILTVSNGATMFGGVTYLGKNAGSSGTITVDGAGSTFRSDQYLYVGDAGTGILNITNGAVAAASNSCSVYIANSVGSTGMVTVDGTGSTLASNVDIIVGNNGSGELNIAQGGLVSASAITIVANGTSSTGAIHFGDQGGTLTTGAFLGFAAQISGTGTINTHGLVTDGTLVFDAAHGLDQTWAWTSEQENVTVHLTADDSGNFNVMGAGYAGTGTLTIRDGMAINSGDQYLGRKSGSSGVATVDGTGSKWTGSGYLAVGFNGQGALAVTNGGTVTARSAYLGEFGGSSGTLTVDGTSSVFSSMLALYVADYGTGVMAITHGGTATCTPARVGNNAGSSGTVTVDGTGSTWVCGGSLMVGNNGVGVLNITNGGAVSDSGPGYLGVNGGSSGVITVDGVGSKWTSGALTVGSSGAGTLSITNGGAVQSGGDSIGSAGKVTVDGVGSSWTDNGGLTINGAGGELNITNGGLVTVGGGVSLAGGTNANGSIRFGDHGGTLTAGTFWGLPAQVTGVGTIIVHGFIADDTVLIETLNGTIGTWTWASAQANVTVNLTANNGSFGSMGAGYVGTGVLTIRGGVAVKGDQGFLGYSAGSSGTATVEGMGSMWTCNGSLTIGNFGTGMMSVTQGGSVTSSNGYLGNNASSSGMTTVDGTGSKWTCGSNLYVGYAGTGVLNITNGGAVSSIWGYLGNSSRSSGTVTVDGTGSTWTCTNILSVGGSGKGAMYVTHGGAVSSAIGTIRNSGTVTLDGTGSKWTCSGSLTIGDSGTGILRIINGGSASNTIGFLGYSASSSGLATVDGMGSMWGCSSSLAVGFSGSGMITITQGGVVSSVIGDMGYGRGSSGAVTVDGAGSKWTNSGSLTVGNSGVGRLAITNGGTVTSAIGNLGYNMGSAGTVTVDGIGSMWTSRIVVGVSGVGVLAISGGGTVNSSSGGGGGGSGAIQYVGYNAGAGGTVTVDGTGSTWKCDWTSVYVGHLGTGVLTITDGGWVNSAGGKIGSSNNRFSSGIVTVDGTGSRWTSISGLTIGGAGTGTLKVTNGGTVTMVGATINSNALVAMNVGDGSKFNAGTGALTNSGVIRLTAAVGATAGTYTPVTAGSWAGTGAVQALGGKWDTSSHVFTVSEAMAGAAGVGVEIDRAVTQRVVITDGTTLDSVRAEFMGTSGSASVTLTGWELTEAQERTLAGVAVLEGWTFAAEGYTAGEPVSLAMKVGSGWTPEQLSVWHYDGSGWVAYAANDLSYDGAYASFTVYGFSGYAVTGVPEPASVAVLVLGMVGVMGRRRRNRK